MDDPPDHIDQPRKVVPLKRPGDLEEHGAPAATLWPVRDRAVRLANEDWMRGLLAAILIGTFCVVAGGGLVLLAFAPDTDKVARALALVFSALSGVTGAVSGFYFGGRRVGR